MRRTAAAVAMALMLAAPARGEVAVGAPLPSGRSLGVVDLSGAPVDLHRMIPPGREDARAALIVFWATWCAPCIEEIPVLRSLQDFHAKRGLRIVGVGVSEGGETLERVAGAAARHKLNYDILFDREGEAQAAFNLIGIPWSVLIDGEGVVRWVGPALPRDIDERIRAALTPQEERAPR